VKLVSWYGDGVGNTIEENSNISSLIQIHQLPSARAVKFCFDKIPQFSKVVVIVVAVASR